MNSAKNIGKPSKKPASKSIKPKKPLEKEVQKAIQEAFWAKHRIELVATDAGGKGFRGKGGTVHGHSGIPSGFPDLVGVIPPHGRAIYIEVKRPGEKVDPYGLQAGWLQKLCVWGAVSFWASSVDSALKQFASFEATKGEAERSEDESSETRA